MARRIINLNNTNYEISFKVQKLGKNSYDFIIFFSDKYPETELRKNIKNRNIDRIGYINLSYNDYIYIHGFYVKSDMIQKYGLQEELKIKGIGKELLCYSIQYLQNKFKISDDTIVKLDASGTREPVKMDLDIRGCFEYLKRFPKSIARYLSTVTYKIPKYENYEDGDIEKNLDELIQDILENYASSVNIETLREYVGEIESNLKLAKYYNNNYGFEIVDDSEGISIGMETDIKTVLSKCTSLCKNPIKSEQLILVKDFTNRDEPIYCYTKEEFIDGDNLKYIDKKIKNITSAKNSIKHGESIIYLSLQEYDNSYFLNPDINLLI